MNKRIIVYILGWVLIVEGIAMQVGTVTSFIYREHEGLYFLIIGACSALVGVFCVKFKKQKNMVLYQKAGFQPNILIRTNDYESILMMVAAEEGVSILPEYCIGKLRSVDNITYRPLAGEEETEEVLAVWNKENITPELQHFIDGL